MVLVRESRRCPGVVHMLGGVIGFFMAAGVVDNRPGRFIEANPELLEKRNRKVRGHRR